MGDDIGRGSRCGGGVVSRRLPANMVLFSFLERETITAVTVSDSAWDQRVISDEVLEGMGPAIQDLVMNVELRNTTGLFECRIGIQRKFLDADWTPASGSLATGDLVTGATPLSADGFTVVVPFNDRARLGAVRIRLLLQYHAKATGGGLVGAKSEISVCGFVRPWCC